MFRESGGGGGRKKEEEVHGRVMIASSKTVHETILLDTPCPAPPCPAHQYYKLYLVGTDEY